MKDGKASWTAEGVTFFRALESMRPESGRACYDPLARHFLSPGLRLVCRSRLLARRAYRRFIVQRGFLPAYCFVVARTACIDECLEDCIRDGIEQLVILGAGNDSRAYRFEALRGARVFEVDHPATQRQKVARVERVLGGPPGHVAYVPVDFERDDLRAGLYDKGYDPSLKTLFIWEGVTTYLTPGAVDETLGFVVKDSPGGSTIVFTYIYRALLDGLIEGSDRWRAYLERRGEPPRFGIEEGTVKEFLGRRGFIDVEDVTPALLEERYLRSTDDDPGAARRLYPTHAVARATVG